MKPRRSASAYPSTSNNDSKFKPNSSNEEACPPSSPTRSPNGYGAKMICPRCGRTAGVTTNGKLKKHAAKGDVKCSASYMDTWLLAREAIQ